MKDAHPHPRTRPTGGFFYPKNIERHKSIICNTRTK